MATPEGGFRPGGSDEQPHEETEPRRYQRAARFAGERSAGESYYAIQRVIYEASPPVDLSVYRLQLNALWHVAALGFVPPASVLHVIEEALAPGDVVEFPAEVWQTLADRRAQQIQKSPWTERHFRPGRRL